ncbi:hypothetical protein B0A67_06235 [Flavobacterium aquidurense]|nr:hypothetical protein B0A67_06235 [Flavobacterium aquidurense]
MNTFKTQSKNPKHTFKINFCIFSTDKTTESLELNSFKNQFYQKKIPLSNQNSAEKSQTDQKSKYEITAKFSLI